MVRMPLLKRNLSLISAAAVLLWAAPAAADDVAVRIMTQNVDEGTDFQHFPGATTPQAFAAAVTATYEDILATKPAERAVAIAGEIAREGPDIVALQEATTLRTGPTAPATTVQFDWLQSLTADLNHLGAPYAVVAVVPGIDVNLPSTLGFDVRLTRQDAILVRLSDSAKLANIQAERFGTQASIPTPLGPIPFYHGFASVDVSLRGATFRFATTHLMPVQPVERAQMNELISGVGGTALPLSMAGDFNANADDSLDPTFDTYQVAIDAGFVDAWSKAHGADPGFTCCQAQDVLNATSSLSARIDLAFLRGDIGVDDVHLVGDSESDRTPSGLWPSDHAGLVATLEIPVGSAAVPEASTWAMMLIGFAGLGFAGYRASRKIAQGAA